MTTPPGAVHKGRSARIGFAIVDVFAVAPLTGNALAVVPDADALDVPTMRAIAREFNQSETTFLVRPSMPGATRRLRWFTPGGHEVGGAGHNALGAWLWLARAGRVGPGTFTQQIGRDLLPVEVAVAADEPTRVTMAQSAPWFGRVPPDRAELAAALGLSDDDLVPDRPAQVVSTGAGHLLVPVVSRTVVDRVAVDTARLLAALAAAGGEGCYATPPRRPSPPTAARVRALLQPRHGHRRGPRHRHRGRAARGLPHPARRLRAGRPVLIQQGNVTGRPSRLQIEVDGDRVRITGTGLVVGTAH